MNDHFSPIVNFLPREVVVILDAADDLCAQQLNDVAVEYRVIRRRIFAHQIHCRPVVLAFLGSEVKPCETSESLVPFR